jgi:hypothetical protein
MKPQAIAGKIYNFKDIVTGIKELVGGINLAIGSSAIYPGMLMTALGAVVLVPDLLAYAMTYGVSNVHSWHVNPEKIVNIQSALKKTAHYSSMDLVAGLSLLGTFCATFKIGNALVKNQVLFAESDNWKEVFGIQAMSSGKNYLADILRTQTDSELGQRQYTEVWKNQSLILFFNPDRKEQSKWAYLINNTKVQYTDIIELKEDNSSISDNTQLKDKLYLKRGDILRVEKAEELQDNTVWLVDNVYDRMNNGICNFIMRDGTQYTGTRLVNPYDMDAELDKTVIQFKLTDLAKVELIHTPLKEKLKMGLELFCHSYETGIIQNEQKALSDGFEKDFYDIEQYVYFDKEFFKKHGGIEVKLNDSSSLIYTHVVPHGKRYNDFMRKERAVEYQVKSFNPLTVKNYNLVVPDIKTGILVKAQNSFKKFMKISHFVLELSGKKSDEIWHLPDNEISHIRNWKEDIKNTKIRLKK